MGQGTNIISVLSLATEQQPPFNRGGFFDVWMIPMPLIIELITEEEIAYLENLFGPLTVIPPVPVQSLGEMPEPEDPDEKFEYYRQMMETNTGVVA